MGGLASEVRGGNTFFLASNTDLFHHDGRTFFVNHTDSLRVYPDAKLVGPISGNTPKSYGMKVYGRVLFDVGATFNLLGTVADVKLGSLDRSYAQLVPGGDTDLPYGAVFQPEVWV